MNRNLSAARTIERAEYGYGVRLVLLAGVCWSITGLIVRLMEEVNEWQILFYRSLTLIVSLSLYLTLRNRSGILQIFRAAGRSACLAGLFLGCSFSSWIFAVTHTTIGNALFILSASPFFAAVLGHFILNERVQSVTWGLMTVAGLGVAIMVVEGISIGTLSGNIFALMAAFGFAVFSVILRREKKNDMTPAVCWAGIWGAIIGVVMLSLSPGNAFVISIHDLGLCMVLGVFQVSLGLILFTEGARYLPVAELTLLSLTEVVLGPVWVWLAIGEIPTPYTLLGGAVILLAIVAQAMYGIRKRPPIGLI